MTSAPASRSTPGREGGGSTLGAVDDDLQRAERRLHDAEQVPHVRLDHAGRTVIVRTQPADIGAGRAVLRRRDDERLDLILDLVGELEASAAEHLDPVVGHRIVAGGKHDPEVGAARRHGMRHRRGRHHTQLDDVSAGAREARRNGSLEQLAGRARVAADHDRGARHRQHRHSADCRWPWRAQGSDRRSRDPEHHRSRKRRGPSTACCTAAPCGPSSGRTSCAP